METISIEVESETAKAFRAIPQKDKRKIEFLFKMNLRQYLQNTESLEAFMRRMSDEAVAKGLTPEILQEILDDEEL